MWWWIVEIVFAVVLFICWIVWEVLHTLIVEDIFGDLSLEEDDEDADASSSEISKA